MKLARVKYLLPLQCRGLIGPGWWTLVVLFVIGLIVFTTGVGWDGEYPTFFGVREVNVGASSERNIGIPLQLASYLSLAWVAGLFVYAVPVVLFPLANSFSQTHTCWLRGLPCSPREVAAARGARLLVAISLTTLLGLVWVGSVIAWHQITPEKLLTVILGWSAHLLLSGGFLLAAGPYLAGLTERVAVVVAALFIPIVLWLPTFLIANRITGQPWESWLPYACPLTENFTYAVRHYAAAAFLGLALVGWSVIRSDGRIIRESSLIPETRGVL
jgi:hypothetical protein